MESLEELSRATDSAFRETGLAHELWPHQRAALEYVARARRVLLADEVGVGKTAVALASLELLRGYPAVVVPPAHLRYQWQRAAQEWLPGVFVHVVEPNAPLRPTEGPDDPDIFIVSYNLIQKHLSELQKLPIRTFISDEGHYLKNPKAQRTKACRRLAAGIPTRLILTATPTTNRPIEFVSLLEILEQVKPAFGSAWGFLQRYCNRLGPGRKDRWGHWDFSGARNTAELNERLRASCYVRRTKGEVHANLPPLTEARVDLEVANTADCAKARTDFLVWLGENGGAEAVARAERAEALAKVATLKRLASVGKRPAATAWIEGFLEENADEKLVLFTALRETAHWYAERYHAPKIEGGVPIPKRDEIIKAFQLEVEPRVIVVNMASGGAGIELFTASNCVFLEYDWSPSTHTQAAGRLHRPGQQNPVTAWSLVGRGTVEEVLWQMLLEKEAVVAAVTEGGAEAAMPQKDALARFLSGLSILSGGLNRSVASS